MDDKIITLATLTYERAQLVKSLLENEGVHCFLEHINLIQGAISSGVQINIKEADFEQAMMVFDAIRESDFSSKEVHVETESNTKILVPVDFSEYSKKAVDFAFEWACKLKGEITLFNSYYSPIGSGLPFSDSYVYDVNIDELSVNLKEESEEKLKKLKLELMQKIHDQNIKGVSVHSVVQRGIAEHEILNYSQMYKPSVIVMGTRGADKKAVDLIGSVTAEIIELSKRPVMAIPESFNYTGIENIKKIAYLTVFDEQDFIAIERLIHIVNPLDVTVTCCHITNQTNYEKNKVKMDGLIDHFRKHKLNKNISFKLIVNEDFLVGIESLVQLHTIDILSFTTYKRSLIARLLNPSIAKKMLFHSTTPLLVFHA